MFPELGMIMYPLFWIKYTLHLLKEGYDVSAQKHLFFWAGTEPSEGVLYYSLLSKFYSKGCGTEDVSVGTNWAKGWLFKPGWKDNVTKELEKIAKDQANYVFHEFTKNVFSSDFKTDCRRAHVNISRIIKTEMLKTLRDTKGKDYVETVQKTIEAFARSMMKIFHTNKGLHCKEGAVIEPNIEFTRRVLLQNSNDLNELSKLANVNFNFTKEELKTLLTVLQTTEKGRYFLRSMLLVSYVDPLNHSRGYVREKMRDICDVYRSAKDFEEEIKSKFDDLIVNRSVLSGLEETCFCWALNFFLADGEEIARRLLGSQNIVRIIRGNEIKQYFSGGDEYLRNFMGFLERLKKQAWRAHLTVVVEKLRKQGSEDVANYMARLLEGIEKYDEPYTIFIELLLEQGTLKKEAENIYSVVTLPPEETSTAFFYGIDPIIDWSRTTLKGLCNE